MSIATPTRAPGLALAQPGVTKLGRSAWTFSLPAVATCPGRSAACSVACYATKGRYHMGALQETLRRRHALSREGHFAARVIREIAVFGIRLVRVHVSGDFDSVDYAEAWLRIMRACRDTRFWFYTRSWRNAETNAVASSFVAVFKEMAALPNVSAWYSSDRETGRPPRAALARRIKVAYMATDVGDRPAFPCDLVFLVKKPRTPTRRLAGVEVCPYEDGVKRTTRPTCDRCRKCVDRFHTIHSHWERA